MTDRYFVDRPITGPTAQLAAGEAHHLTHVMRAKVGQQVTLFDGSGAEFAARVERMARAEVELSILSRAAVDRELPVPLILGVSLPKGDRQRWLAEKATELGVTRLVPLVTQHSAKGPTSAALERLRRAVIEASKQCGRNRLMEIAATHSFDDFVAAAISRGVQLLADPTGSDRTLDEACTSPAARESVAVAIGPEGGFAAAELERATASGWKLVALGPRILRVETAAVALAATIADRLPAAS